LICLFIFTKNQFRKIICPNVCVLCICTCLVTSHSPVYLESVYLESVYLESVYLESGYLESVYPDPVYLESVCFRLHILLFTCFVIPNAWNALLYSTSAKCQCPGQYLVLVK